MLLAEFKAAWLAHSGGGAAGPGVAGRKSGVEGILASYHGASLFHPRELLIVLDIEDLGRSDKKIAALAEGIARHSETSTLILVESAAEAPRKTLAPLRESCQVVVEADPPTRPELLAWGETRFHRAGLEAEPGLIESIADACEGDALTFFNEIEKLSAYCGAAGRVRREDATTLLRPVVGAELPEYLIAVARGAGGRRAQRGVLVDGLLRELSRPCLRTPALSGRRRWCRP